MENLNRKNVYYPNDGGANFGSSVAIGPKIHATYDLTTSDVYEGADIDGTDNNKNKDDDGDVVDAAQIDNPNTSEVK